jgi:hypothetical protein
MDVHANPAPSSHGQDPSWTPLLDRLYSHTLLWPGVPSHPDAVTLWLGRLVDLEVRVLMFFR